MTHIVENEDDPALATLVVELEGGLFGTVPIELATPASRA